MDRGEASQNFTLGDDADWVALPGAGDQAEAGPVPGSVPRLAVQGVEHGAGEVGRDVAPAAPVPAPAARPRPRPAPRPRQPPGAPAVPDHLGVSAGRQVRHVVPQRPGDGPRPRPAPDTQAVETRVDGVGTADLIRENMFITELSILHPQALCYTFLI